MSEKLEVEPSVLLAVGTIEAGKYSADESIPLRITFPPALDDELRKASEELRDFVKMDVRWNRERDRLLANLDAALEKK